MNEEIRLLERVCLQIYTTPSADERKQAETVILNLADDPECLRKCQLLLDQARFSREKFLLILDTIIIWLLSLKNQ